jgi:AraC-like DNA-binding protein
MPQELNVRDFPSYAAYHEARRHALYQERIRGLRHANRHLSLKEIAYHAGVSEAYVRQALEGWEPPRLGDA